eukprot:CAMPEP_0205828742 /NCGR_PEP_ID=MMETSP0206-20130828/36030_1 /ASSEMBLY_ACC=CAM_ASM_000279 /TAXON_ID=36767 /ORGANISM="Euplotes focardii, Strain TN1" /LENGTH=247 /DNA_ID=CAMNT_0053130853 /DNA_START=246 /DNA_END=990 /DNA_ORIENTATION=-
MAPMATFLKKNSSIGETPFLQPHSPKRTELQEHRKRVGLCSKHFHESGLYQYIGGNEPLSDDELSHKNFREFTLGQLAEDMSDVQSVSNKKILKTFDNGSDIDVLTINEFEDPNPIGDLFEVQEDNKAVQQEKSKKDSKRPMKIKKKRGNQHQPVGRSKRIKTGELYEDNKTKEESKYTQLEPTINKQLKNTQKRGRRSTKNETKFQALNSINVNVTDAVEDDRDSSGMSNFNTDQELKQILEKVKD